MKLKIYWPDDVIMIGMAFGQFTYLILNVVPAWGHGYTMVTHGMVVF